MDLAWQHFQKGRLHEAEELYLQILQTDPDQVDALHLLGVIAAQAGRNDRAVDYLSAALRLKPDFAEVHNNLGNVFINQKKFPEAVASFEEAVHLQPDFAAAHNNLGNALREQGRLAEAITSLQHARRIKPDYAAAHYNLGLVLLAQGKLADAQLSLQQAVRQRPDYAEAHNSLGAALRDLGQLAEAEASLKWALRLKPDYAEAHYNLGIVLWRQERLDAAVASNQDALRLQPDHAEAQKNLGHVRKEQGRLDDAIAAFRSAIELKPDEARFHSNLILTLNMHPEFSASAIYEECRRWNQQHAEPLRKLIQPHSNDPDHERRMRIGYVSPDFRGHPISAFVIPLLSNHDRRDCEILCYSDVARPDTLTEQTRAHADVWRSTVGLSDQQMSDLVRNDRIDILVDLAMHTVNNRLLVFARKPAPVQVSWLAYPSTTGLSTMDYRLTDPYLDPPGLFDALYSEESIRLPETFWCYDPLTEQPPVNALPAFENGGITFGCLNYFPKVNDGCLRLWARVLDAVPRSRLLLLVPRGQARDHVLATLEQEGITAHRLEFAARQPRQEYFRLYQRIDLALDPFPCNGGTTNFDAAWMGVPTVTLVGETVVGRAGFSQLCNLGLKELAAETPEQYVALAARLAADLPRLQELRATLRRRMLRSPLMDANRFARHMEQAYRQMWRRWCQQTKPAEVSTAVSPGRPSSGQGEEIARISVPQTLALAVQHYQKGDFPQAEQLFGQILQVDPGHLDAMKLLGVILHRSGRQQAAMEHIMRALKINPDFAAGHYNLGIMLREAGKLEEAAASFREAIRLQPDSAPAHVNLAEALIALPDQARRAEAVSICQQALRLKPDYAGAHYNLGLALYKLGRLEEAVSSYRETLRLKPDFAEAYNNLGAALHEQGRIEEAVSSYREAIRCNPAFTAAHANLGRSLCGVGKLEEALNSCEQAIRLNPEYVAAHFNRAICWLLLGDFERGWPEFEWRWKTEEAVPPPFPRAPWDGSSLTGRTILLHAEQGLGDTIQFVRYASLVKKRGGTVLVRCPQALVRLLSTARGIDRLIPENSPVPAFDVEAALLSLPKVFGTSLATIPAEIPYLFVDPELAEQWRRELERYPGFRIGIAWQGNPKHTNDRQRSFPLEHFAPVAGLDGVRLFSLQKGPGQEQLPRLGDRFAVVDLASRLGESADSFMDAAAVMKNLDLVITVDSAVAHLAGALGVPVWVALPVARDWRWLLEREDSPWYPTMRLFRQRRCGDWAEVFEWIAAELQGLVAIEPRLRVR